MVLFHQYVPDKIQGLLSSKIEDRLQRNHEFDQQNVDNHLLLKDCLNASAPTRKQDFKVILFLGNVFIYRITILYLSSDFLCC